MNAELVNAIASACPKCGATNSWKPRYCGPSNRAYCDVMPHKFSDESEHLILTCSRCDYCFVAPCADAKP